MTIVARICLHSLLACLVWFFSPTISAQVNTQPNGQINIAFINTINNQPIVLGDSQYINPSNEAFTITKLKYYVSHISFRKKDGQFVKYPGYFLVNEADDSSKKIAIQIPEGDYYSLSFLLGVDSIANVSGAQTGSLDPLNGMYWTWNSGYIMFKVEGQSPVSSLANKNFEYHIGGYAAPQNALRTVKISLPQDGLWMVKNATISICIAANLDRIWSSSYNLTIHDTPACNTPGKLAGLIADNLSAIFSLKSVGQHICYDTE